MTLRRTAPVLGRPPLPVDEVRSAELRARVTEAERERIQALATRAGQSVSDYLRTWTRGAALTHAMERKKPATPKSDGQAARPANRPSFASRRRAWTLRL